MKKRKNPQQSWEDKVLDFCTKAIIPIAVLWGITGCIAIIMYFGC